MGLRAVLAAWLAAATAMPALAAEPNRPLVALERYEGFPIESVEVHRPSHVTLASVEAALELGADPVVELRSLARATRQLFLTGWFRQVLLRVEPLPNGRVVLVVVLDPKRVLGEVVVEGEIDHGWAKSVLRLTVGDELDERSLPELEARLEAALARRGYRESTVGLAVVPLDDRGRCRLLVRVAAGARARIGKLVVVGELPYPPWDVDLGSEPGAPLDLDRIGAAVAALEARLRYDGYLDVRSGAPVVMGTGNEVDVRIPIDAGPRIELVFRGNHRMSRLRLREDGAVLQDLGTSSAGLDELRERVLARYEQLGYYRARVEVAVEDVEANLRRVEVRIAEGPGSRVIGLSFPGAQYFTQDKLREQVEATVAQYLASELGRAGVDPEIVTRSLRRERTRPRRQPSTAAPDPNRVYVPRAYRAAADIIGDLYRSAGFQSVRVDPPELLFRGPELIEVSFAVEEGIRWRVGSLAFFNHPGVESGELFEAVGFALRAEGGQPLVFEDIELARRAILRLFLDRGYVQASVRELLREVPERGALGSERTNPRRGLAEVCARAAARDATACDVEVGFAITPGPRVKVGEVLVRGLQNTVLSVVEGEIALRPGEWMSRSELIRTRDQLIRLGVFDRVVVRPSVEDGASTVRDLLVELRPRKTYSLNVGFGASTEEGLRVFARFADRNLFGRALRLQANAKVNLWVEPLLAIYEENLRADIRTFYDDFGLFGAEPLMLLEFEVAAGIAAPRIYQLPNFSFGLDLTALRDFDPAFQEESQRATLLGTYDGFKPVLGGRARPVNVQLRLAFDRTSLGCNPEVSEEDRENLCSSEPGGAVQGQRLEGENVYLSLIPRVSWDLRDDPLLPRQGIYIELESEFAAGFDSPDYIRVEGKMNGFVPLGPRFTFMTSLRGGRIFPLVEGADIPLNRRFYAGGRSTIRGYPEQTLLPQDVDLDNAGMPASDISLGGLLYLAAKLELQWEAFSPLSLATFYDMGALWRLADDGACGGSGFGLSTLCTYVDSAGNTQTVRRRLAQGVGVGIRLSTPIGPLAVDLGVPVARQDPAVEDFTLHFSVGAP